MLIKQTTCPPIDFEGLTIYDFTADQETSSSFAVIDVPPRVQHREAYSNRSDKYYYVIHGTVQFTLGGTEHTLIAGDFCLVRQGRRFAYANLTGESARLILVHTPSFDLNVEVFVGDDQNDTRAS